MNEEWWPLLERIRQAEEPRPVLDLINSLTEYEQDTRWRVLSAGLDRLWELDYDGFEGILLEQCLLQSEYIGHFVHSRLKNWLKEEGPEKRREVISWFLKALTDTGQESTRNAIECLISIGYRSVEIEHALRLLIEQSSDSKTYRLALWALVGMGYGDKGFLEDAVRRDLNRPVEQLDATLCHCGRWLASTHLVDDFIHVFRQLPVGEVKYPQASMVDVLYVLADTADRHPNRADGLWDVIMDRGGELAKILTSWSGIANHIDAPDVPVYFVKMLGPTPPDSPPDPNRMSPHYHAYLTLKRLNRSHHLTGLRAVLANLTDGEQKRVAEALYQDATRDTGSLAYFQTGASISKETSWDVILRLGLPQTPQWLVEALQETGPFTAGDICRYVGFLRVEEAVEHLRSLVSQDGWDIVEGRHITLGLAALGALGRIGTLAAFEALMTSKVSFNSEKHMRVVPPSVGVAVPQNYSDAIADCVVSMGDAKPLVKILEAGIEGNEARWIASASAMEQVVLNFPELLTSYRDRLYGLCRRSDLLASDLFRFFIPAIGLLPYDVETETRLLQWAQEDSVCTIPAIQALARWGVLQKHDELLVKLGLENRDGQWHVSKQLEYRVPFIIGLLFLSDSDMFSAAMSDVIESGSHFEIAQILQFIDADRARETVISALIRRAMQRNGPFEAEMDTLWLLSRIIPEMFAAVFHRDIIKDWYSPAREAIAECCDELPQNVRTLESPISLLKSLLTDPDYAVRRVASRSLARLSQKHLSNEVEHLMRHHSAEQRIYCAEAAIRLTEKIHFESVVDSLAADREPSVRAAVREAERERRRIAASQDFTSKVVATPPHRLLDTWHYGQALIKVGDDDTLRELRGAAYQPACPPNKRAYLDYIFEALEKEWRDRQSKRKEGLDG